MASDDGYFPHGTMLRRVHSERTVGLLYGRRALAIGALHPLAYAGTALHTRRPDRPFQRLADTGKIFEKVMFGSKREADRALNAVAGMHRSVQGQIPHDIGPHAAGTAYSAYDPELMLWTVGVIADSATYFYELLVRPLAPVEKFFLWRDYLRFGQLFGMEMNGMPSTYDDFAHWFDTKLHSRDMHLSDGARSMGLAIAFDVPLPSYAAAYARHSNALIRGSLPDYVRREYGIQWNIAHRLEFEAAVTSARMLRKVAPRRLAVGPNAGLYAMVKKQDKSSSPNPRLRAALTL